MTRRINAAGLSLIKSFESLRLKAYRDTGGVATIGWGHTKGVKMGQTITEGQASDFLIDDLEEAESAVERFVSVPLNDNQFAALVSFTFNCGSEAFRRSTLRKKLNAGDYASVPGQLARWVNDNGKKLNGLVRRRRAEGDLWSTPFVASKPAQPPASAPKPIPSVPIPGKPESAPAGKPVAAKGLAAIVAVLIASIVWFWETLVNFVHSIF